MLLQKNNAHLRRKYQVMMLKSQEYRYYRFGKTFEIISESMNIDISF